MMKTRQASTWAAKRPASYSTPISVPPGSPVTNTVWSENNNTLKTLDSKLGQSYNGLCMAHDFLKNENTEKRLQQDNSYIQ